MPILKKNGKLRVCLDFINLNFTTSNDKYSMSMTNISIDLIARNDILSFMNGYSGYNQIFIIEKIFQRPLLNVLAH
jgi:hypothetical protein